MTKDRLTSSGLVKARVAIDSGDLATGLATRLATELAAGQSPLDGLPAAERAEGERLGLGPHRLSEFRAGRLAAHAALDGLLGPAAAALVIARADDGAPMVVGADVQISISHGRRFAVAVAAAGVARVGIDLCEVARAPSVERVSRRFLHASERALCNAGRPADWAALWALKEAAAKALRRGLFDGGLAASRLASLAPARFAFPDFEVDVETGEEDVVATVWLAPGAPAGAAGGGSSG